MKMDFRRALALTLVLPGLSACGKKTTSSPVYQKPVEECAADVVPNRYIVRYKDGAIKTVSASSVEAFLSEHVEKDLDKVAYSEPDYFVRVAPSAEANTNPPPDNWAAARVGADSLWSAGIRGGGVAVAVIDSGMDLSHPQLQAQVMENPGEAGAKAVNGIDDDGNGLIDDHVGYDFNQKRPLQGDYQMHGTHVAGIVAAAHSDTVAGPAPHVQGIAPEAKILPLAFLNASGSGMMSDAVTAIIYAVARGARVINASWGGTVCSKSLRDAIDGLSKTNVVFVAAAGNDSLNIDRYKEYPASLDFFAQITVGATGDYDYLAQFSNYGSRSVHIFAPGQSIVSTVPGGTASFSGTSMAAPVVSGAVALLVGAEPTARADQIRTALYNTAFKQSHYLNACQGRLDLRQALTELRRQMGK